MSTLELVVPTGSVVDRTPVSAPAARSRVSAHRLALVVNGKPNAGPILRALAAHLGADLPIRSADATDKTSAAVALTDDEAAAVAAEADVAILGVGDCGACTACSIDDAVKLERLGVPTVTVITEPFQGLAAEFALRLGMPALTTVVLPHPVASRPESDLLDLTARVATAAAAALT